MPRLFSAYVIVDWSASSKPNTGTDSVWIGVLKRDVRFRLTFEAFNPSTRAAAETQLMTLMDGFAKRSERALVGFDFPLGFPRGYAAALKLPGEQPWRAAWDDLDRFVKDKADNTNNRFGVAAGINRRLTGGPFPFWGCPPKDALSTLQPKKTLRIFSLHTASSKMQPSSRTNIRVRLKVLGLSKWKTTPKLRKRSTP